MPAFPLLDRQIRAVRRLVSQTRTDWERERQQNRGCGKKSNPVKIPSTGVWFLTQLYNKMSGLLRAFQWLRRLPSVSSEKKRLAGTDLKGNMYYEIMREEGERPRRMVFSKSMETDFDATVDMPIQWTCM